MAQSISACVQQGPGGLVADYHPFVLLPGHNEWSNCRQPLERLKRWRQMFCDSALRVATRPGEYCEHRRWEAGGWVFVALNLPGHDNNIRHPEHGPRMKAVFAWLDEAAALAANRQGLAVLVQANPFLTVLRDRFKAVRERLEKLAAEQPGKVVLVHSDTHIYRYDGPLPGLRRIEVWGSPIPGWLRAVLGGSGHPIDIRQGP